MPELTYMLFLGCLIPYRAQGYEVSSRKVLDRLGVNLVEMPEFNCCGFPLDPISHEMMLTLAARDLCLAEKQGLDIVTLCNGCFGTLKKANTMLSEDRELLNKINGYLGEVGLEYKGTSNVKHLIQVLIDDVGLEKIKQNIQRQFDGLKVAEHYGCHVLRPEKIVNFEDPEDPKALRELIEITGAEWVDYVDKLECCGQPMIGVDDKIPLQLSRDKLKHIKDTGAQAMVTICPACHMMYDLYQSKIEGDFNESFGIPVFHYPQLLGLAMGLDPDELGLGENRVKASGILNFKKGS